MPKIKIPIIPSTETYLMETNNFIKQEIEKGLSSPKEIMTENNDWETKYLKELKNAKTNKELKNIIDSIYEDGYTDGVNEI